MNEYYQLKREWLEQQLEIKKGQLADNMENNKLTQHYKELKQSWMEQQKEWQSLIHQYA